MSSPQPTVPRTFRTGIFQWFLGLTLLGVPLTGVVVVLIDGGQVNWVVLYQPLMAIVIFCLFNACWLPFTCPVRLTADGIHAQSVWGLPRFIGWPDLTRAKSFRLLNL